MILSLCLDSIVLNVSISSISYTDKVSEKHRSDSSSDSFLMTGAFSNYRSGPFYWNSKNCKISFHVQYSQVGFYFPFSIFLPFSLHLLGTWIIYPCFVNQRRKKCVSTFSYILLTFLSCSCFPLLSSSTLSKLCFIRYSFIHCLFYFWILEYPKDPFHTILSASFSTYYETVFFWSSSKL